MRTYAPMRLVDLHCQPCADELHREILPYGLQLLACVAVVRSLSQYGLVFSLEHGS